MRAHSSVIAGFCGATGSFDIPVNTDSTNYSEYMLRGFCLARVGRSSVSDITSKNLGKVLVELSNN
jgi:hypothetical protein